MNKRAAENKIVVLLFVFVTILFSFAQKDTQKLKKLYTKAGKTELKLAFLKSLRVEKN
jgi:hypothetical protein